MQVFTANKKVDRLTGLPNMEVFYESVNEMAPDRSGADEPATTVIVFDILGLRDINRSFGHAEGDARIAELAGAMRRYMPAGSFFFRGHEADLIAVCRNMDESSVSENVDNVASACGTMILFGIGSTAGSPAAADSREKMVTAMEDAQVDLKIKKMLNINSHRSQTLISLVSALKEVDQDTEEHVRRTRRMGTALGERIGLSDYQITLLQLLCLLHDIGKIAVPLEILNKPGRLSADEWAVLRSHPEKGYQIVVATEELKPLADGILDHHERWDGRGYPSGLSGEDIPVLSRIISIVDAYDAMVNDRCYRKAMDPEDAKKEIRDNAGTQFDPRLASEFLSLLEEDPSLAVGSRTGGGEIKTMEVDYAAENSSGLTRAVTYSKYTLDLDDVIIDVDDAFETLTGYSRADAVGRMTQFDLIPDDERENYINQVRRQLSVGSIAFLTHPLICKDGTVKQVICSGERHFDSSVRAFRSTILVIEIGNE